MQETLEVWVTPLGLGYPLEERTATRSSILAWGILCREEPGGLQSVESQSRSWLKRLSAHTHTIQNRSGWEFLFCFKRRTQPAKTPQYSEIPQRRPGIQLMPDLHVYPESLSLTQLCESPGSMGFPRREHTGAGCHFFLRGIFPTQGSNSHLLCLLN